jgi:hypothetical protein
MVAPIVRSLEMAGSSVDPRIIRGLNNVVKLARRYRESGNNVLDDLPPKVEVAGVITHSNPSNFPLTADGLRQEARVMGWNKQFILQALLINLSNEVKSLTDGNNLEQPTEIEAAIILERDRSELTLALSQVPIPFKKDEGFNYEDALALNQKKGKDLQDGVLLSSLLQKIEQDFTVDKSNEPIGLMEITLRIRLDRAVVERWNEIINSYLEAGVVTVGQVRSGKALLSRRLVEHEFQFPDFLPTVFRKAEVRE